ncbi:MAG: hypothetical protein EBU66_20660, partial [Bacteroidetes bacterium]|nr:hypothetical protein [Bacteroidota bacterium]
IERLLAIKIKIKVPIINKDFINHIINTTKYRRIKVTKGFASFDKNLSNLIQVLEISNEQLYKKGPFILPDIDNSTLARIITYYICGNMESECLWGLTQNMNKENFVLFDALNYVYKYSKPEFFIYYPPLTVKRRCAIDIEPYLSKNHRAGWKYVVDNLMNFYKDDADLFVDSYVDRTFHWGYDVNRIDNKIPYVKPWIGFIHHTFAEVNDYNIKTLLQKELFIESLKNCKGIIVLSSYLAHQLIKQINVPVFTLTHPTLFVEKQYMFKYSKFVENENRKIIQIGAWMRNPVSIYKLSVHSTHKLKIKKAILQGNNMNVTFSLDNFSIEDIDNIGNLEHSVEIINTLTNTNYDILLSENIVFLDLIDCSAVNTVIECVVRNTPLIVNRHHALEEVLGKEYPGFYNTLEQAGLLISYPDQIK